MKAIKKAVGGFMMILGAMFILLNILSPSEEAGATVLIFIFGLIIFVLGLLVFRGKAKEKKEDASPVPTAPEPKEETPLPKVTVKSYTSYYFTIAGISFREEDIIENIMIENDEYNSSKRELLELGYEEGDRIYKYEITEADVTLLPDPENEYDPNAIKVIADGVFAGYVPRNETRTVSKIMEAGNYEAVCRFTYGPYKVIEEEYDDMTDKVITHISTVKENISGTVKIRY